jgi:hypothetical protein
MHHQRRSTQKVEYETAVDTLARGILFDLSDTVNLAGRKLVHVEQALPSGIQPEN